MHTLSITCQARLLHLCRNKCISVIHHFLVRSLPKNIIFEISECLRGSQRLKPCGLFLCWKNSTTAVINYHQIRARSGNGYHENNGGKQIVCARQLKNLQRDVQKAALSSLFSQTLSADTSSQLGWAPPHCQSVATGRNWVCTETRNDFQYLCGNTHPVALQAASHRSGGAAFTCHLEVVCVPPVVCTSQFGKPCFRPGVLLRAPPAATRLLWRLLTLLCTQRMMRSLQSSCTSVCETSYLMSNNLNLP